MTGSYWEQDNVTGFINKECPDSVYGTMLKDDATCCNSVPQCGCWLGLFIGYYQHSDVSQGTATPCPLDSGGAPGLPCGTFCDARTACANTYGVTGDLFQSVPATPGTLCTGDFISHSGGNIGISGVNVRCYGGGVGGTLSNSTFNLFVPFPGGFANTGGWVLLYAQDFGTNSGGGPIGRAHCYGVMAYKHPDACGSFAAENMTDGTYAVSGLTHDNLDPHICGYTEPCPDIAWPATAIPA